MCWYWISSTSGTPYVYGWNAIHTCNPQTLVYTPYQIAGFSYEHTLYGITLSAATCNNHTRGLIKCHPKNTFICTQSKRINFLICVYMATTIIARCVKRNVWRDKTPNNTQRAKYQEAILISSSIGPFAISDLQATTNQQHHNHNHQYIYAAPLSNYLIFVVFSLYIFGRLYIRVCVVQYI